MSRRLSSAFRRRLVIAAAGAAALAAIVALIVARARPAAAYYFMPGPLGRVAVPLGAGNAKADTLTADRLKSISAADAVRNRKAETLTTDTLKSVSAFQRFSLSAFPSVATQRVSVSAFSGHHYLTRAISGLRAGAEQAWGRHNGLTPALFFSHNLLNVFPRTLYATHPDFFPLVEGKRLDPPPGYTYWNPDLGRKDVAAYAAAAAKRYFDQHPDAVSFSLGVDDGLVFGESAATLALTGVGPLPFRSNDRSNDKPGSTGGNGGNRVQSIHSSVTSVTSCSKSLPPTPVRWFRHRPDYSRLVFTFMNRAAADLAKSYPDKYLGCLAYYWCENTPGFRVDPHVIPFLTADRSQSYDPAFVKQEFDVQARWARALRAPSPRNAETLTAENLTAETLKSISAFQRVSVSACPSAATQRVSVSAFSSAASQRSSVSAESRPRPRLGLYDYLDDWGFLVPRVPIHAFAEHIRHAYEVGFTDYFGESERNWGLDGPMPWVIAQLLQNPEQNVDRLLDTYYRNYFGPAAGPMRAFFDRCEYQWMHQPGPSYWLKHYRNESQARLFPPDACRELRCLLNEAAALASGNAEKLKTDKLTSISASQRFSVSACPVKPDWPVYRKRVAFVSDSFGVTERFVAFEYARDALSRATLNGTVTPAQLNAYLAARREFIRYSFAVTHRWPLAFYPINYTDWLENDPSFAAAYALAKNADKLDQANADTLKSNSATGGAGKANAEKLTTETLKSISAFQRFSVSACPSAACQRVSVSVFQRFSFSPVADGFAAGAAITRGRGLGLLPNGSLEGPLIPGRKIAGLPFGIDLPAPWLSKVEPTEHHLGVVWRPAARTGTQGLRISGAENDSVYQWVAAKPGELYAASVAVRGQVSLSCEVELDFNWLDAAGHYLGSVHVMRLPDGLWPKWVTLRQGGRAPATAAWVGVGIRVQHQAPDDWVEADDFSLRAAP